MTVQQGLDNQTIDWASSSLTSLGFTLKTESPEIILNTPWSSVARFATDKGYIYLKQTPEKIKESKILNALRDEFKAHVVNIIAGNTELHCFLMEDAGCKLRDILKQQFDTDLLCKAITQFTALQLDVAERVQVLLDVGVPDWRLDKMPELYKTVVSQKEQLMEEDLTEIEIKELESLLPMVSKLCDELSSFAVKESIVQPDFNDNNHLWDDAAKRMTLIDLGEIVISHPFFALLNIFRQMKKHYGITEEDDRYQQIKDACFKSFMTAFDSQAQLAEAIDLAQKLWPVYWVLATDRLIKACGKESVFSFRPGLFADCCRQLLSTSKAGEA